MYVSYNEFPIHGERRFFTTPLFTRKDYMSKKIKEAVAHPATLSLDSIKEIKGFNPRSDLGNLELLTASIKATGILQPLLVRPGKKDGTYELISGHRRHAAADKAKLKEVPVLVREDLGDDADALAAAVAENSDGDDGIRQGLNPIDEAGALKKLLDGGMSSSKVGHIVGRSGQHVRRTVTLLDAPKDVQKAVSDGTMSKSAAIAVADLDAPMRKKVMAQLDGETSEKEVKRIANSIAKEEGNTAKGETKGKKSAGGSEGFATWKSKTDVRNKMEDLIRDITATDAEGGDSTANKVALATLFWMTEAVEDIDIESKEFAKALKNASKSLVWETAEDTEGVEESESEKPKKAKKVKAKKGKKNKTVSISDDEPDESTGISDE